MFGWFATLTTVELALVIGALAAGFYMAWTIGANDVANSMGTSVGSGAVTLKQAVVIAGVFEFAGAVLVGSHVSETIKGGIISAEAFPDPMIYAIAMLACLIAATLWVFVATYFSLPISTTHAIVGAVLGVGLLISPSLLDFSVVQNIMLSWLFSPLLGALLSFIIFKFVVRSIFSKHDPISSLRQIGPALVFVNVFFITLSIIYKGLSKLGLDFNALEAIEISAALGIVAALISMYAFYQMETGAIRTDKVRYARIEKVFGFLQVMTACSVAFAHGANDVANAIGPLAAVVNTVHYGAVNSTTQIPIFILLIGGVGIVIGISTWGYKVIETVGRRITEITPSRGFSAELGTTLTVLLCSKIGLPISTTQVLIGSVMGVGFARGIAAIDFGIIRRIIISWMLTLPVAAVTSIIIYIALKGIIL
jgi:PiT family inorganic phosphate transporter